MSPFHFLIWQKWLLEGRTLEKTELHTGSSEQERICLTKWPGTQSPKRDGADRKTTNMFNSTERSYHAGCSNSNEKLKSGQIMLWKPLVQWVGDWEILFFFKGQQGKGHSAGKWRWRKHNPLSKKDFDAPCCWRSRAVPTLYTQDVQFQDPACSHWQLFLTANSRLQ